MKTKLFLGCSAIAALIALAACGSKSSADTSSASTESPAAAMPDMSGMQSMSGMAMDSVAKTGKGVGVITEIDAKAATVTIKHDAIAAVGWPAMTMTFKANPATLLTGLKVGEKVAFDVSVKESDAEVMAIQPK